MKLALTVYIKNQTLDTIFFAINSLQCFKMFISIVKLMLNLICDITILTSIWVAFQIWQSNQRGV